MILIAWLSASASTVIISALPFSLIKPVKAPATLFGLVCVRIPVQTEQKMTDSGISVRFAPEWINDAGQH